jgi:glycerophosphoryl diester phosphodiesterase
MAVLLWLPFTAMAAAGWKPIPTAALSLRERLTGFRVGAHRGGMSFPDQNTLHRFDHARREGVDIIETDLRVSRDGEVFLFHDRRMDDLTTCTGFLSAKTASEIRGCRLKGSGLALSTFRELLSWSAGRVVINAELKNVETVAPAIRLVREFNAYHWVYFQADGKYDLARALDYRVVLSVSPEGQDAQRLLDRYLALGDPNLLVIELHSAIRTPRNVRVIHAAGKLASEDSWHLGRERFWWGTRRASCDKVFRLGIDIAITDVPGQCVAQRREADQVFGRLDVGRTSPLHAGNRPRQVRRTAGRSHFRTRLG